MTPDEAVVALDALETGDPEATHWRADDILREAVPPEVSAAYRRVIERTRWWAHA